MSSKRARQQKSTTRDGSKKSKTTKKADNAIIEDLRSKEAKIVESKLHSNQIVSLLDIAKNINGTYSDEVVLCCTQSLRRVFAHMLTTKSLVLDKITTSDEGKATAVFQTWVQTQFKVFADVLLCLLHKSDVRLQVAAVHTIMQFARVECEMVERFMTGIFFKLLMMVCLSPVIKPTTISELVEKFLTRYADTQMYSFKVYKALLDQSAEERFSSARKILNVGAGESGDDEKKQKKQMKEMTKAFTTNLFQLLLATPVVVPKRVWLNQSNISWQSKNALQSAVQKKNQTKLLSECWVNFLKLPFSPALYKEILVHMHQDILPRLTSPLLLADFLTDSYNIGGIVSLLALNGLFVLIINFNLDYPQFYPKLYKLLTPAIFQAKYRTRFYRLLALFLSSKKLPSYLVASFIKRLCRLALTAPPGACYYVLALCYNLLRNHPVCQSLLNRPPESITKRPTLTFFAKTDDTDSAGLQLGADIKTVKEAVRTADTGPGEDPFDAQEDDPSLTNAPLSSLWEIKSLESHYCPQVARLAKVFFSNNAPKMDYDITEHAQDTYTTIFTKELNWRRNQKQPLAFERQDSLFFPGDVLSESFDFS